MVTYRVGTNFMKSQRDNKRPTSSLNHRVTVPGSRRRDGLTEGGCVDTDSRSLRFNEVRYERVEPQKRGRQGRPTLQ